MENESDGFFSDITVTGGFRACSIGSQQFTSRNLKVDGTAEAFYFTFFWLWTMSQITVTNCDVGFNLGNGGFTGILTQALVLIDGVISANLGILSLYAPGFSAPQASGAPMIERADFCGSPTAAGSGTDNGARRILAGGQYVELFAQGNAWTTAGSNADGQAFNGTTCTYQNSSQFVRLHRN
jgi:glucan 1,3-beta-glucosidase